MARRLLAACCAALLLAQALPDARIAPPDWEARHSPAAVHAVSPDQWRQHAGARLHISRTHFALPDIAPYLFDPGAPRLTEVSARSEPQAAATTLAAPALPAPPPASVLRIDSNSDHIASPSVVDRTRIQDVSRPPPRRFSPIPS